MGSVKRKSIENPIEGYDTPAEKQQKRGNELLNLDEPVACVHDVSYPEGYVPRASTSNLPDKDAKPAKEFPFTLDPFQAEAIKCLKNGESVLVNLSLSLSNLVLRGEKKYDGMCRKCEFL